MKRKIVLVFLVAVIATILLPTGASALTDGAYTFDDIGNGNCRIRDYNPSIGGLTPNIPSTLSDGGTSYTVTEIGNYAFAYNSLTSVTIPNTVTKISGHAFYHNALSSVTIPNTVTEIGDSAFYGQRDSSNNRSLTALTFEANSSLVEIGNTAFSDNALNSVTIPNTVTLIGDYAFYSQRDSSGNTLTTLAFEANSSLVEIGNRAFGDNALSSVTIPNTVIYIGDYAFCSQRDSSNNRSLTSLTFDATSSLVEIGNRAFESNALSSVTIPNTVTLIGSYAFNNQRGSSGKTLTSLTFDVGSSLETIEECAFLNNSLNSVTIPNSVTLIGENAFFNNNLSSFALPVHQGYHITDAWKDNSGNADPYHDAGDTVSGLDLSYEIAGTGKSYIVTFDNQGGNGNNSVTATYGSPMPTPLTAPTKTGYTFNGYYTQANGGGTQYYNDDMTSARDWNITSDTLLYADWAMPIYTVSFNSQGGNSVSSQSVSGGDFATEPTEPTRTGYDFGGWYTDSSCDDDDRWNFNACQVTADTTLFAKWTENISYTVQFDSQGGTSVSSQTVPDGNLAVEPTDPTRTDYDFGGWYTDSSCTDGNWWNFTTSQVTSNTTLYAKWTSTNAHDLEFDNTYKAIQLGTTDNIETVCPYTMYPSGAVDKSVSWTSSNTTVATISGGVLTTHAEGKTIITVTANDTTNGTISTQMMVEVIDSAALGLDPANRSVTGVVLDSNGAELNGYTVTTYSNPMNTLTQNLGNFLFKGIAFTHHTLVVSDENGIEVGRFTLNFNNAGTQSISIDNANNVANINYFNGTELVDFTIQANSLFNDIDIIAHNITGTNIVINPRTGDFSYLHIYLITAFILLAGIAGYGIYRLKKAKANNK